MKTPPRAKAWLELVLARRGDVDRSLYTRLQDFVSDFQIVNDAIQEQNNERRSVSYVFLLASAMRAGKDWLCDAFDIECHHGAAEMAFVVNHLIPGTRARPLVTRTNAYLSMTNVDLFILLERSSPSHVPCGVHVLNSRGFYGGEMTTAHKFALLTSIHGSVTHASVKKAMDAYDGSIEPCTEYVEYQLGFTDVLLDGARLTERRDADGYINSNMLLKRAGKRVCEYLSNAANRKFMASMKSGVYGRTLVEIAANKECVTWVHPKVALRMALWTKNTAAAEVLGDFDDDTVQVRDNIGVDHDEITIEPINVGKVRTERRSGDMYVQGSLICRSFGRDWSTFQGNRLTKCVEDVSQATGIDVVNLVYATTGCHTGVWVHPDIAAHLVERLDPNLTEAFVARLDSPLEADAQFVKVRGASGVVISWKRTSDGFHDANTIIRHAPNHVQFTAFKKLDDTKRLISTTAHEYGPAVIDVTRGTFGGTWTHPRIARALAEKGGVSELDLICEGPPATRVEPMLGDDGEEITESRTSDGYINATKMCISAGKRWSRYLNRDPVREAILVLDGEIGGKAVQMANKGVFAGSWVHPRLAADVAVWCGLGTQRCFKGLTSSGSGSDSCEGGQECEDECDSESGENAGEEFECCVKGSVVDGSNATADDVGLGVSSSLIEALMGPDGFITEFRNSDGFINATKMCKSAGKKWSHYWDSDNTRLFLGALKLARNPEAAGAASGLVEPTSWSGFVEINRGGHAGTWVSPLVAINLAQWCSPRFAASVSKIVFRYATGQVTTTESQSVAEIITTRLLPSERAIASITGTAVPPATPGVYFAICSHPDASKFTFPAIPDGKVPVGFGWSATSKRERVENQMAETGDYRFLDGFDTLHGFEVEKEVKALAKHCGYDTVHGTYTCANGKQKTKTEFLLLDQSEYCALHEHARTAVERLEGWHATSMAEMTKHKTTDASVEVAREVTKQKCKDVEIECEKTKQVTADAGARIAEAESAARIAEAEVRKVELQLELARLGR